MCHSQCSASPRAQAECSVAVTGSLLPEYAFVRSLVVSGRSVGVWECGRCGVQCVVGVGCMGYVVCGMCGMCGGVVGVCVGCGVRCVVCVGYVGGVWDVGMWGVVVGVWVVVCGCVVWVWCGEVGVWCGEVCEGVVCGVCEVGVECGGVGG